MCARLVVSVVAVGSDCRIFQPFVNQCFHRDTLKRCSAVDINVASLEVCTAVARCK